jgi:urea transport system substrate-binding protein
MPSTASSCPTQGKLVDLEANALPAAEADQIRRHIAGCPDCQAGLARAETLVPYRGPANGAVRDFGSRTNLDVEGQSSSSDISLSFLRAPSSADELGRLGDYRIVRIIGSGGMGIVFEAEDVALGRRVALKVLRPELTDDEFRQRFLREAQTAASLPHDHIVTIYQVGEDNGVPYMAMEFLRGQSVEARLRRDNWLPLADALDIARQAAEGLAVAHDKGLIHRDIKPDNLWLESGLSGPIGRVKLLDFGLARPVHGPSELTAPGQIVGTPGYMAPEVVYGLPVDFKADLYSLGCVLYRMLTGKTPYADESADTEGMLRAAVEKDLLAGNAVPSGLPTAVVDLLKHLLARDPASRPVDARAVITRLRDLQRGLHEAPENGLTLTAPVDKPQAVHDGVRFGVWAGALSILLALLVGGAVLLERILGPMRSPDPADANVAAAGNGIPVGLLYSLHGSYWHSEKPVREATLQAIREINEAGGISGRPLVPVSAGGGSDEEEFAREAEKLITQDGVAVLFGCWSSSSRKRVEEVCARHDRLLVYAVPDEGLEQSPNVFYLGGTPNQLMIPAVRWVYTDLRKRRFFLAGSEDVFSKVTHVILRHEIEALGATVVGEAFRTLGATDFESVAMEVQRTGADIVLCTIDGLSNVALSSALRGRGLRPPAVPTVWFNVGENELRYMNNAKKQMVGDYAPFCYFQSLDSPDNIQFVERFRAAEEDPTFCITDPMEASYVGVYLWKQAVEAAGSTDTDKVRETFRTQSFAAPEGMIRIDSKTQRAWRTPRVGRVNNKLDFDVVWAAPNLVDPQPYPPFRTRQQWDQFLQDLYKGWGGHWEEHGR